MVVAAAGVAADTLVTWALPAVSPEVASVVVVGAVAAAMGAECPQPAAQLVLHTWRAAAGDVQVTAEAPPTAALCAWARRRPAPRRAFAAAASDVVSLLAVTGSAQMGAPGPSRPNGEELELDLAAALEDLLEQASQAAAAAQARAGAAPRGRGPTGTARTGDPHTTGSYARWGFQEGSDGSPPPSRPRGVLPPKPAWRRLGPPRIFRRAAGGRKARRRRGTARRRAVATRGVRRQALPCAHAPWDRGAKRADLQSWRRPPRGRNRPGATLDPGDRSGPRTMADGEASSEPRGRIAPAPNDHAARSSREGDTQATRYSAAARALRGWGSEEMEVLGGRDLGSESPLLKSGMPRSCGRSPTTQGAAEAMIPTAPLRTTAGMTRWRSSSTDVRRTSGRRWRLRCLRKRRSRRRAKHRRGRTPRMQDHRRSRTATGGMRLWQTAGGPGAAIDDEWATRRADPADERHALWLPPVALGLRLVPLRSTLRAPSPPRRRVTLVGASIAGSVELRGLPRARAAWLTPEATLVDLLDAAAELFGVSRFYWTHTDRALRHGPLAP